MIPTPNATARSAQSDQALGRAVAEHLTILPLCPFARRWLKDHPETAGTVRIDWALASIHSEGNPNEQGA